MNLLVFAISTYFGSTLHNESYKIEAGSLSGTKSTGKPIIRDGSLTDYQSQSTSRMYDDWLLDNPLARTGEYIYYKLGIYD